MKRLRTNAPTPEPRIRLSADPDVTAALMAPEPPGRVICSGCGKPGGHRRLKSCPRGGYIKGLTAEVVALKEKLIRAGLYKTGHAMEAAVTAIGYEIAECLEDDAK